MCCGACVPRAHFGASSRPRIFGWLGRHCDGRVRRDLARVLRIDEMAATYELYVKKRGRWNFEAQFAGHLREAAIAEARDLETHVEGVKVIREQTDAEGNVRESTLYNSERSRTGRLTPEQRQAASSRVPSTASRGYVDIKIEVRDEPVDPAPMEVEIGRGHGGAYTATRLPNRRSTGQGPSKLSPEGLVLSKLLTIVMGSFAFAAFITWMLLRSGFVAT